MPLYLVWPPPTVWMLLDSIVYLLKQTALMADWGEGAFRSYFYPGAFGRLVGFWFACCQASYAYLGVKLLGIVAEETERPRETIPRAARLISYRIVFYYVGAVLVLGLNVSADDPALYEIIHGRFYCPFALMMDRAGLPLANFVHILGLVASFGLANASLYVCVCS